MSRAGLIALLLLAGLLGCEPTRNLNLSLPEGIAREEVLLEVAVYVAATPNVTCRALELGIIDGAQLLPTRVLVAGVDDTSVIGAVPRDERRLVVGSAFTVEGAALVAKGCVELGPRENGARDLPLLPTVEASFAVEPTVVARVDGEDVSYEVYDEDFDLTGEQTLILDLRNPLLGEAFVDAPLRVTVRRADELIVEEILEDTAGRISVESIGVDAPGFYHVEIRARWSAAPLTLDVGAFVIEPLEIPALDGADGAEISTLGGAPLIVSRAGDALTFSPLDGAPTEVTVPVALGYVGHAPELGALFNEANVGLHLAPFDGGALQLISSAALGNFLYPVTPTSGCDAGNRFVVTRLRGLLSFLDRLDLDAGTITNDPGNGGLPTLFGPSACVEQVSGGPTRVGVAQGNVFGLLIAAAVSGSRFELGLPLGEVILSTPTSIAPTLAFGRDAAGHALIATPDFEGVSISAYLADLDGQLLLRQREALVVPVQPVAIDGGDAGLEGGGPFDVAISHLGDKGARLDIGQFGQRAVLPLDCDPQEATAPLAPPPCQLRVADVDDDGADEILVLRTDGGVMSLDLISLDP